MRVSGDSLERLRVWLRRMELVLLLVVLAAVGLVLLFLVAVGALWWAVRVGLARGLGSLGWTGLGWHNEP